MSQHHSTGNQQRERGEMRLTYNWVKTILFFLPPFSYLVIEEDALSVLFFVRVNGTMATTTKSLMFLSFYFEKVALIVFHLLFHLSLDKTGKNKTKNKINSLKTNKKKKMNALIHFFPLL